MQKKPQWLKIKAVNNPNQKAVTEILENLNLNTVCHEANCPNQLECFSRKTATFMILGTNCTRNCGFCNVRHEAPQPIDPDEPRRIARAVKELEMRYIVITSVTRDDLPDGGAEHFAKTIEAIRKTSPNTGIEVLVPDFKGGISALKIVANAEPTVIGHNMETVKSMYAQVRPQAQYERSLELIKSIKKLNPTIHSKSAIMLGLGETMEQVHELFDDLQKANCEFITIGQYLTPSPKHLPVQEYITPTQFDEYAGTARKKGFKFVTSAPFARSSYHADEALGVRKQVIVNSE